MIIMHEYPLSMVEHAGFRRFCHALQPVFHVISRNTVKRDIFKIYNVEKLKTMRLMERNKSRVSLITDMWTSICKKRGFMVITAHINDDSWNIQSRILRKLSTLTVDNCTTNDAMIDLLVEKLGGDHIRCKSLFHVQCVAHILNLIVKYGLDVIKSSIVKLKLKDSQYKNCPNDDDWNLAEDICKSSSKDRSESLSKAPPSTYLRDRTSLSDYLDQQKKTKTVHVKSELDRYLKEEQLPMCDDFDILAWWKSNCLKYPVLQAIARDVLTVPVSTVASESSFSTSGSVVLWGMKRFQLSMMRIWMLMTIRLM
ncbi:hypothetical protein RHSIM_Rhsim03G0115700 [Rhododendron simsii]|uniref:HAT C-terminal dimerisation domain-containing protein n=1 Tax=Rhododendron simsii TaxID=118357 RepID=A0A834H411_RHOSS|nr:hypothetical protein RHSIM_Rhsim03G0115700 [Rhododendron simsii]